MALKFDHWLGGSKKYQVAHKLFYMFASVDIQDYFIKNEQRKKIHSDYKKKARGDEGNGVVVKTFDLMF